MGKQSLGQRQIRYRSWLIIVLKILRPWDIPNNPHALTITELERRCKLEGMDPEEIQKLAN